MNGLISDGLPTKDAVHQVLKDWRHGDAPICPFSDMLLFHQVRAFGDLTVRAAANQILVRGLDEMAAEGLKGSQNKKLLEMRFYEDRPANQVAIALSIAEGTVYRLQAEAIERLAEILQSFERNARTQRLTNFADRLETATYTQLIGRDAQLAELRERISRPEPPWQFAIEGIGGIGKTSMADALARSLLGDAHWHDFAWVTARHQTFNGGGAIKAIEQPALTTEALIEELVQQLFGEEIETAHLVHPQKVALLKERLHDQPHLIVIDNLETVLDVESLLGCLRDLAGPSKFLLTTRHSRYHEAGIYHFTVPELALTDALALIRQEAVVRNVPGIEAASDDDLTPIVTTVGGNPLALRLVVGQLHTHPLSQVLDDLQSARGRQASEIYTYIYRQAWQEMDEVARQVLLLLPLALESGGDFEYLAAMGAQADLSSAQIGDALGQLVSRNLVDSRGDLLQRRYSIHGLTRVFLHQQVLNWADDG